MVDPAPGQLVGDDACPLQRRLDQAHSDPLLEQRRARSRSRRGRRRRRRRPAPCRSPGAISSPHACAACGEPITTIRSPGRIMSSPPGRLNVSPRMIPATLRVGRHRRSRSGTPRTRGSAVSRDVELDELHLALGEDVRLPRRRHADRPRDRVRGLDLRGDDEVDVELALVPHLEVLRVGRPHDRRHAGRDRLRDHRGDDVRSRRATCRRSGGRRRSRPHRRARGGWRRSLRRSRRRSAARSRRAGTRRDRGRSARARRAAPRRSSTPPGRRR